MNDSLEVSLIFVYLFAAFLVVAGIIRILLAHKIYESRRRSEDKWLARTQRWHPAYGAFYRWSFSFRRSISPEKHVFDIRFGGAILILAGVLLAFVISHRNSN